MTDFNITRNVYEEFDLILPEEFQVNTGYAAKFRLTSSLVVAPPTMTVNGAMTISSVITTAFAEPEITVTGPSTLNCNTLTSDCYLKTAGTVVKQFSSTDHSLSFGSADVEGGTWKSWIPFIVALPKDQVIVSATLYLTAHRTQSGANCKIKMACDNTGNAVAPTSYSELNSKTLTTSYNAYRLASWTLNTVYSYDVTGPVQEILNHASWVNGNTLAILCKNNGSQLDSDRSCFSYNNGSKYPTLTITY